MSSYYTKINYKSLYLFIWLHSIKFYTFGPMEYMTVKQYAKHINKSVPLIYKRIKNKELAIETKFGMILIPVKTKKQKA